MSTAIPKNNPEIRAARAQGVPVLRRAEILALLARTRRSIAVAGTHGKTTTSSMLALALVEAGLRPSFIIGGDVNEIGSGAVWDSGELFVVEADESDGTFLELGADTVVVTNIEPDHLDHYGGFANLESAFERFTRAATGARVLCADDANTRALIERLRADGVDAGLVRHRRRRRRPHHRDRAQPAEHASATSYAMASSSVSSSCRCPACTTCATRRRADRCARNRRLVRRRHPGAGSLWRCRPAIRASG